jgi:hypothetical protein
MPTDVTNPHFKGWYRSKTLWINAGLAAGAVVLEAVPDTYAWVPLANMILRYFTTTSIR